MVRVMTAPCSCRGLRKRGGGKEHEGAHAMATIQGCTGGRRVVVARRNFDVVSRGVAWPQTTDVRCWFDDLLCGGWPCFLSRLFFILLDGGREQAALIYVGSSGRAHHKSICNFKLVEVLAACSPVSRPSAHLDWMVVLRHVCLRVL